MPTLLRLETEAPVDDILVRTSADGWCFVNAKVGVGFSDQPDSPLASVVDQFVRQWLVCAQDHNISDWERPLDPTRDRLVLATAPGSSSRITRDLPEVIKRIVDLGVSAPRDLIATTGEQRNVFDTVASVIRGRWRLHSSTPPTDAEIKALLRLVRVQEFRLDEGGADLGTARLLLRQAVVAREDQVAPAWSTLTAHMAEFGKSRSGGDRTRLREILRAESIALADVPEYAQDVGKLREYSDHIRACLAPLAELTVPAEQGLREVTIPRRCIDALCTAAAAGSFLVVGEPGAGKSGALHVAVRRLAEQGHPVIYLAVDRLPVRTFRELEEELGVSHRLLDVLRNWTADMPGIVVIDALDATRGSPSEKVFQDLIRLVLHEAGNWHVVASIRQFDLRHGQRYRDLFAGSPVDADFASPEFGDVRHLNVPRLEAEEIDVVWQVSPAMRAVFEHGSAALRDLLRSPFNLFLLATVLRSGGNPGELAGIATQVGLLRAYWERRVIGEDRRGDDREEILRRATEVMIASRSLVVRKRDLAPADGEMVGKLLSDNVLSLWSSAVDRLDPNRLSFSHHVLFDYAIARLVLENGRAPDIVQRLAASEDQALMLAPAATMAFHELWTDEPAGHRRFWETALRIVSERSPGGFCQIVAPAAAVPWIRDEVDFAVLVEALRETDQDIRRAARVIAGHLFGALIADVLPRERLRGSQAGPWTLLVLRCAEAALDDLAYPLRSVVVKLLEDPGSLTGTQRQHLGRAAHLILAHALDAPRYDAALVNPAIQAVVKTIDSDPAASVGLLRRLLAPEHFAEHAHEELFWLTHDLDRMIAYAPEFLVEIYGAAFGGPLPSRDKETRLGGSLILPLISNRLQDFQLSQHNLAEGFHRFIESRPRVATEALIVAMEGYVKQKERSLGDVGTFRFGDVEARFQADRSCVWWPGDDEDRHHDDGTKLLDQFIAGLGRLIAAGEKEDEVDAAINLIVHRSRLACVWTALLRLAVRHPRALGRRLLPLVAQPTVLESYDTAKAAGDLVKVLHPLLADDEKAALERAILAVADQHRKAVLVSCLDGSNPVLGEVRAILEELKAHGPLPENRPPVSFSIGWGPSDEDWWLKEQGVDLEQEPNRSLKRATDAVKAIKAPDGTMETKRAHLTTRWRAVIDLYEVLKASPQAGEALRMQGWDVMADAAGKAAETCGGEGDLEAFPGIETVILEVATSEYPQPGEDSEASFEQSPSWGSPAPRVEAAGALMLLARAKGRRAPELADRILGLAKDLVPAVRFQVLARVNVLSRADPELMWELCEHAFAHETNRGILPFFLSAFQHVMAERPDWAADRLVRLGGRLAEHDDPGRRVHEALVGPLLRLWLVHDEVAAGEQIAAWLTDPVRYVVHVTTMLQALRDAMLLGEPGRAAEREERIRTRAVDVYRLVVEASAAVFHAASDKQEGITDEERKRAVDALRVLDAAATEIYFGSKAYEATKKQEADRETLPTLDTRKRFLREMGPVLRTLGEVRYPSVTHHLLETLEYFVPDEPREIFRLITDALLGGGATGGYQYEALGADLFVKLIQRYLADHRSVLLEDDDSRRALLAALDRFVEAGWPEARRLVYELPAMLR